MIWDFERKLSRHLCIWGGVSIISGFLMLAILRGDWLLGFAGMFIGWGVINGLIAWVGQRSAVKKQVRVTPETAGTAAEKETRSLRRILLVNTGLDVLYILGGTWMAVATANPLYQGAGWGIVIQGAALFLFDLLHVLLIPKPQP